MGTIERIMCTFGLIITFVFSLESQETSNDLHFELGLILVSEERLEEFIEIRRALAINDYFIIEKHLKKLLKTIESVDPRRSEIIEYYEVAFGEDWVEYQLPILEFVKEDVKYTLGNLRSIDFSNIQEIIYLDRFFHLYLNPLNRDVFYISPRYYFTNGIVEECNIYKAIESNLIPYNYYSGYNDSSFDRYAFLLDVSKLNCDISRYEPFNSVEEKLLKIMNFGIIHGFKFVITNI